MTSRLKALPSRTVETLKSSAFVGGASGLQLLISNGGVRTWRLYYRLPGSTRRRAMKLGHFPDLSLSDARKLAQDKLALVADGVDPRIERKARVEAIDRSVAAVLQQYLLACASLNDPKTVADKKSALTNTLIREYAKSSISTFDRVRVAEVLDKLADRPALRRVTFAYLRHFLGWCVDRGLLSVNPMLGMKPPRSVAARERILTDDEIRRLWQAQGLFAEMARLSLLTAQRKATVHAMRWEDVDRARKIWTIPGDVMKSGRVHEVPLTDEALGIIATVPRMSGRYLFGVGSAGERPFGGASKAMISLRKQTNADWRLHDLRRTAVTLAQRSGATIEEIRALTQHKTPGVIGVYARHSYSEEKRRVAEVITARVNIILINGANG